MSQLLQTVLRGGDDVNIVVNGTFDTSIAGWTPFGTSVFEWVAGTARGVRNDETVAETTLTTPVQAGKQYKLTFDIVASSNTTNGYIYFRLGSSIGPTTHRTIGTHEWVFTALSNTDLLELRAGGLVGLDFRVDNISLIKSPNTVIDGTVSGFHNGLGVDSDGLLVVTSTNPIATRHQGLPFDADGRLCVALEGTIARYGSGAAPFDASGRLVVTEDNYADYIGGVPYANGRVCI
jgi:hypothetical protein